MRFVFLYSLGENYDKSLIGDHIRYLKRMAEEGKNLMSGPFIDDAASRGIAIIEAEDEGSAQEIYENDPGIQNKVLQAEILKWNVMFEAAK